MNPSFTRMARRLVAVLGAAAVVAAGSTLMAPAAQAYTSMRPTITSPGYDEGNALTVGAPLYFNPPTQPLGVNVGGRLTGSMGALDYGLAAPVNFKPNWYSCPSRNAAIANCTLVQEGQVYVGSAANRSFTYTTKTADIEQFIRYAVTVRATTLGITGSVTEYSDPTKDIYVLPGVAKGQAPTLGPVTAGSDVNVQLGTWTAGQDLSFRGRTVTVWVCTAPDAGQVTTGSFEAQQQGCDSNVAQVKTRVNGAAPTAIVIAVPANTAGKTILVGDTGAFTTATGFANVMAVRSAALPIQAAAQPTPTPSATATPSPSPSPSATSRIPVNPYYPAIESARKNATSVNLAIAARSAVTRGKNFRVTLNLSLELRGVAKMAIKKQATARARSYQTLKTVNVNGGTGTRVNQLSRGLAKGKYFIVAVYKDDLSGISRLVTKPLTVN